MRAPDEERPVAGGAALTRLVERPWLRAPNFGDVIAEAATLYPERAAVIADGLELDYRALDERTGRLAALVRANDVAPGEVVALAMGNDARFVESLLGVLRAGAVALLVNTKLGAETHTYIGGHSEVKLVLGHERLERVERALLDGAPAGCRSLTLGGSAAVVSSPNRHARAMLPNPVPIEPRKPRRSSQRSCVSGQSSEWLIGNPPVQARANRMAAGRFARFLSAARGGR